VRRRRGNAGLAFFAEHPTCRAAPSHPVTRSGVTSPKSAGGLSLTWRRIARDAGVSADGHPDAVATSSPEPRARKCSGNRWRR
jgi:hypothetical protein